MTSARLMIHRHTASKLFICVATLAHYSYRAQKYDNKGELCIFVRTAIRHSGIWQCGIFLRASSRRHVSTVGARRYDGVTYVWKSRGIAPLILN